MSPAESVELCANRLTSSAVLNTVSIPGLPPINNDHVVDAGPRVIYLSAYDGHIYVDPIHGGAPEQVTTTPPVPLPARGARRQDPGIRRHSCRGLFRGPPVRPHLVEGGPTSYPDAGTKRLDGPEFSAHGASLYIITDDFGSRPAEPRPS